MVELIVILILISSFIGMALIFYQKIPILTEFSNVIHKDRKHFLTKIKENLKNRIFNLFSYEIFFQKILSKIRILVLKIENKIGNLLQNLRKRAKEKKNKESEDNYWKEIKNNFKKPS